MAGQRRREISGLIGFLEMLEEDETECNFDDELLLLSL